MRERTRENPGIRVLVIGDGPALVERFTMLLFAGFVDVLAGPVTFSDLAAAIRQAVDR